jgi:predicted aspartyl protease
VLYHSPVKSMRLLGWIQGQEIVMLVNSGSSNTFMSVELAQRIQGISQLDIPLVVKVANGDRISCVSESKQAEWMI